MRPVLDSNRQHPFGHAIDTLIKLSPREAEVAVRVNKVFFVGSSLSPMFQPLPEGTIL